MNKDKFNAAIGIFIILMFFIVTSYFVQTNLEYVRGLIGTGLISMVIYIIILIIATVIAPVNAVPIMPIASNIWGWAITGILNVIGWTLGALIAFVLSRKYGVPLVKKFISLKNIEKFEKMIPEENIFWSIVFFRMSIPVDILSYLLGLFSHIKFRTYALATVIGVIPFAFVFAYAGTLQLRYQILAFLIAVIIILTSLKIRKIYKLKKMLKKKAKDLEDLVNTDKLNILKTDILIKEPKKIRRQRKKKNVR